MKIKTKISKWDLIKEDKKQSSEWEKILANEATDKGLVSKINRQLMQLSITKTTQSKNGQKTWIDISPKKTYRWPTNTRKDAQHCSFLQKCKSKLQWGITSHLSEWPSLKSLQTVNAGKDVEKREHSCTVGGNVNWYSHHGEQYGDSFKN